MKDFIKRVLGGKSNTMDSQRKSRLDAAEEQAAGKPQETPAPKKEIRFAEGGSVRGWGAARGARKAKLY